MDIKPVRPTAPPLPLRRNDKDQRRRPDQDPAEHPAADQKPDDESPTPESGVDTFA